MAAHGTRIAVAALSCLAACTVRDAEQIADTPTPIAAIDLDPDPDVVEVVLVASAGEVEFLPGRATAVLGYRDGSDPEGRVVVPGPLIHAKQGDRLIVHFRNETPRPTTIHWHGLRLPAAMDGNPAVVGATPPGGSFEYEFDVLDAGTFWYHPHVDADEQVELGLHGALIVDALDDPPSHADRLFVLDDIDLDAAGQIVLEPSESDRMLGRHGDTLLVNGMPPGRLRVPAGARERWRFVNAANGRHFALALAGRSVALIAGDAGRIAEPHVLDEVLLAPGERVELLVDLDGDPGSTIELETRPVDRGEGMADTGPHTLVQIELGPPSEAQPVPDYVAFASAIPSLPVDAGTPERSFVLAEQLEDRIGPVFTINGQRWPLNTPVVAELGALEVWAVENTASTWHPFHVHGLYFEVLDIDGVPPRSRSREDTIALPPGALARLALVYGEPGMWMFHCTIFEHAEGGMMGDLMIEAPDVHPHELAPLELP